MQRVIVCGVGSIGRRHISVLRDLDLAAVEAFRTGRATLDGDTGVDVVWGDLDDALASGPDAIIVCNPTALHQATALRAVESGVSCLVEKPAGTTSEGLRDLGALARARRVVLGVAHNLRHHPLLLATKQAVESGRLGRPLLLRAHFGAYLPDWHPWEDYRMSYAGRRDLGGGALLTHIHEPDLAWWLLGRVVESSRLRLGIAPLGTDVDEAAVVQFRHQSGALSSLTLSLGERPPSRTLHISFEEGSLVLDLMEGTLLVDPLTGEPETYALSPTEALTQSYADQMRFFLRAVQHNGEPAVTMDEAADVLDSMLGDDD